MDTTRRTIRKYVPRKEDVIRIVVIELPEQFKSGEGLYEWRFMTDKHLMDVVTLQKELSRTYDRMQVERILDRLYNFRKAYLNLHTGEISS